MQEIKIGIIGGSGIDSPDILKDSLMIDLETPYGKTSAPLTAGKIENIDVVTLARHGQSHSIMPTKVPFRANIWAMKDIGCTHIIATTACGSMKEEIKPGEIVILDQFIDFTKHRNLTFHEEKVVHTPMAEPFCPDLRKILAQSAEELGLAYHPKGTMLTIEGPRFSTRAESLWFKSMGVDAINMSTVPEVILARELGVCYASVAMATDYDCWRESEESVTWEMIEKVMEKNASNVKKLLLKAIPAINYGCTICK